jgi:hypothetical protein
MASLRSTKDLKSIVAHARSNFGIPSNDNCTTMAISEVPEKDGISSSDEDTTYEMRF